MAGVKGQGKGKLPANRKLEKEVRQELVELATSRQYVTQSPELLSEIAERLANGETILQITRDDGMPDRGTFTRWMMNDPDVLKQMMNAYQFNALYLVETMLDTVDGGESSTGNIERDKLKVATLKWIAAKYNRAYFGDTIDIKQTNETIKESDRNQETAESSGFLLIG